jgi:K+-transporting ATPase ATPase C chain
MQTTLLKNAMRALMMFVALAIVTGIVYPLLVTGLSRLAFPARSDGTLVSVQGRTVGSELIGQSFTSENYFHGRPSAAGPDGYDASASSGSNLGPTNAKLLENVAANAAAIRSESGLAEEYIVPADLVTSSASGLDPHISPASAYLQVPRVARARGLSEGQVRAVVDGNVQEKWLGVFGEPMVNVLKLNLDLDNFQTP